MNQLLLHRRNQIKHTPIGTHRDPNGITVANHSFQLMLQNAHLNSRKQYTIFSFSQDNSMNSSTLDGTIFTYNEMLHSY